jgi:hypothetical protein
VPTETDWAGMPTDEIHRQIENQTSIALKTCFELFPFFDLISVQGLQPFTPQQKSDLIYETLTASQKLSS